MTTVIQIDLQADRAQAIDVLSDAGETYHCAPGHRFIVSGDVPGLLRAQGIRFQILGRERSVEGQERGNDTPT